MRGLAGGGKGGKWRGEGEGEGKGGLLDEWRGGVEACWDMEVG